MSKPLFNFSAPVVAQYYLYMSVPFLVFFLYKWIVSGPDLLYLLATLGVFLISLLPYRFYSSQKVRDASFYEDSFTLRGRNLDREISYSSLRGVFPSKLPYLLSSGVRILLKDEEQAILIPYNPRNGKLKTDLRSWLERKVRTAEVHTASVTVDTSSTDIP